MKFELGLDGRAATAATFQAIDPLVNQGQEEALNPAIITNRIHDQLTNVCGANQAAKDAAASAQTMIVSLGTRDATTADAWNTALGFAGTNTNPGSFDFHILLFPSALPSHLGNIYPWETKLTLMVDNAPVTGLVGHT
jgi:hypothetical protein